MTYKRGNIKRNGQVVVKPATYAKMAPPAFQSRTVVVYRPTVLTNRKQRLEFAKLMRAAHFARIVH